MAYIPKINALMQSHHETLITNDLYLEQNIRLSQRLDILKSEHDQARKSWERTAAETVAYVEKLHKDYDLNVAELQNLKEFAAEVKSFADDELDMGLKSIINRYILDESQMTGYKN